MRLMQLCATLLLLALAPCALGEEAEIAITVPDAYAQDGTLAVYSLSRRDFADVVQPEWFNAGRVVGKKNLSKRGRVDCYTFEDEDELTVSGEEDGYVYYVAQEGAKQTVYDGATDWIPARERSVNMEQLALDVYWGYMENPNGGETVREALAFVTLAQAQERVEALLDSLGVVGYACVWALDVDAQTALALNTQRNERIETGRLYTTELYDFAGLTERDEGYALVYRARVDGVETCEYYMQLTAFVSGDGLRSFSLSAPYSLGNVIKTPDALLTAQEAASFLPASAKKSRLPDVANKLQNVTQAELIYALNPKAKGERLQLLPAWKLYFDVTGWSEKAVAYVSAVDGDVLDAPWM